MSAASRGAYAFTSDDQSPSRRLLPSNCMWFSSRFNRLIVGAVGARLAQLFRCSRRVPGSAIQISDQQPSEDMLFVLGRIVAAVMEGNANES